MPAACSTTHPRWGRAFAFLRQASGTPPATSVPQWCRREVSSDAVFLNQDYTGVCPAGGLLSKNIFWLDEYYYRQIKYCLPKNIFFKRWSFSLLFTNDVQRNFITKSHLMKWSFLSVESFSTLFWKWLKPCWESTVRKNNFCKYGLYRGDNSEKIFFKTATSKACRGQVFFVSFHSSSKPDIFVPASGHNGREW